LIISAVGGVIAITVFAFLGGCYITGTIFAVITVYVIHLLYKHRKKISYAHVLIRSSTIYHSEHNAVTLVPFISLIVHLINTFIVVTISFYIVSSSEEYYGWSLKPLPEL